MKKEFKIGLLMFSLTLIIKQFMVVPEVVLGFLMVISLCFEMIGILPERIYQKIKTIKKSLLMNK